MTSAADDLRAAGDQFRLLFGRALVEFGHNVDAWNSGMTDAQVATL